MIYFDTSYLVKCYISEDGSDAVRQFAAAGEQIGCCVLGGVELLAAFHRKLRERQIDSLAMQTLLRQLALDDANGLWTWVELTPDVMRRATEASGRCRRPWIFGLPMRSILPAPCRRVLKKSTAVTGTSSRQRRTLGSQVTT